VRGAAARLPLSAAAALGQYFLPVGMGVRT